MERRRPLRGSIRLGRIFGIPIGINPTWFPLLILVVTLLATRIYPEIFDDAEPWLQWVLALVSVVLFFVSLVLHELGHSVMARYFKIPVRGITLFALGAVAQTTRESRKASHEFVMAAAGPAVSILIAGVFMVLWWVTGQDSVVARISLVLWQMNFVVGIFNLVPAFPMDGGRLLRAFLWGTTKNYRMATRLASLTGQGVSLLLIAFGALALVGFPSALEDVSWLTAGQCILVGLFINAGARQGDAQAALLDYLSRFTVGDAMVRGLPVVLSSTSVQDALSGVLTGYGPAREAVLVSDGERFAGVATRRQLLDLPDERAATATVGDVMLAAAKLRACEPATTLAELAQQLESEELEAMAVVEDGQVVGVAHRGMVLEALRRQAASRAVGELGRWREP